MQGIEQANIIDKEKSLETIKDIYKWESYPVMVLVKVTDEKYIKFGFVMAGLNTVVRVKNLLKEKEILDFYNTKNVESIEYITVDEMINDGWRVSPVQPRSQ